MTADVMVWIIRDFNWVWGIQKYTIFLYVLQADSVPAMATAPIEVSIQVADGTSTQVHVDPGSTAAVILDLLALKLPPGYCACLVTEAAEALKPHSQIWESQASP